MKARIQLKHPAGKKAVSMDADKYDVLKKVLLSVLKEKVALTHTEILTAVLVDFKTRKVKFEVQLNGIWSGLNLI